MGGGGIGRSVVCVAAGSASMRPVLSTCGGLFGESVSKVAAASLALQGSGFLVWFGFLG